MSLIEHLDREGWEDFLRGTFEFSLELLKNDRFRYAGSAVDDMKSWLAVGGVGRVKHHLSNQMETLGYSPDKMLAANNLLDELAQQHRIQIVDLMAHKVISAEPKEFFLALGCAPLEIENLLRQFSEGKSFEEVARSYGLPDDEIEKAKRLVDDWFDKRERNLPPLADPN
ncbi:MAG: hypothetical protein GY719_26530 [bacterium]|nr:hypothetical protein [bacterium]